MGDVGGVGGVCASANPGANPGAHTRVLTSKDKYFKKTPEPGDSDQPIAVSNLKSASSGDLWTN
jgi:hypothetical protein